MRGSWDASFMLPMLMPNVGPEPPMARVQYNATLMHFMLDAQKFIRCLSLFFAVSLVKG